MTVGKKAVEWVKAFADEKIYKGKNIKQLLIYDGMSFWYFMETIIHYAPHYFCSAKELMDMIERNQELEIPQDGLHKAATSRFLKKMGRYMLRRNYWRILGVKKGFPKANADVLMFSHTKWSGGKETYVSKVIGAFKKKVCVVDILAGEGMGFGKLSHEVKNCGSPAYIPIEAFMDVGMINRARKEAKKMLSGWDAISQSKSLKQALTYKGISLHPFLEPKIRFFIYPGGIENIVMIEAVKRCIKEINPKVVMFFDVNNPNERIICGVAKKLGIPVVGVQHGVMSCDVGYMHTQSDISPVNSALLPYCPIADITAVSGKHYKDFLIREGKYKKEWVSVAGQPLYDDLRIKSKSVNSDKSILLVTQALPIAHERVEFIENSLDALEGRKEQVIVKMHPLESDFDFYKNELSKRGIPGLVVRDENILDLLETSALMITISSTSAIEAAIVGTPVILVDFSKRDPYCADLVKGGGGLGVHTAEGLKKAIDAVLGDPKTRAMLAKKRRKFIFGHAYNIDGKASERIYALARQLGWLDG